MGLVNCGICLLSLHQRYELSQIDMFILLHNSNAFSIFAVFKPPESGIKLSPLHRSRAIFIPAQCISKSPITGYSHPCVLAIMAHKLPLGGFEQQDRRVSTFLYPIVMFNDIDNRPAQTQNEPTPRPQLTELLQTTQLCGVSLSVYGTPAEPLFLAKEVAEAIDHSDVSTMMRSVDDDEKLTQTLFASGQRREMWLLTEQGLYEVLMQSRKPVARQFKAGVKALLKALRTGEQPTANGQQPSGTYLRRTARLMESVSNQMHELRRRFAELDEASQMLATSRQEPTPIAGLDPIIMRGRVWYPLRGLLKSVTGSKDPKIEHYTERYPDRTMVYYQMSYCDEALARYIVTREELRQRQEALTAPLFDNF